MSLRIRRGTEAQRTGKTFELGEIVYTTDAQQLWVGDGVTAGGAAVVGSNVAGYGLHFNTTSHKLEVQGLTSDDITQGTNNKYFSTELAVDAVGAALVAGNSTNVGITFTYSQTQDDAGRINATVALDGVGITSVSADTSPELGANLDLNSHNITGVGDIDITGDITASGTVTGDELVAGNLSLSSNTLTATTGVVNISNSNQNVLQLNGINSNGAVVNTPQLNLFSSRGTLTVPSNNQAGDYVGVLNFGGYYSGVNQVTGSIISVYDAAATMTNSNPGSALAFITNNNASGQNIAYFDKNGTFSVPVAKVGNVNGSLPSSPEAGMIVLDGTTFKGYNGSAWVALN